MFYLALAATIVLLFLLGRAFRPTLKTVAKPTFVLEKPPLPKNLAATAACIDQWRNQGRLSREEYEKLHYLIGEDVKNPPILGISKM